MPEYSEEDRRVDFDESIARRDDWYWAWFVKRVPFTWQGFLNWWVARRWLVPRDVTKR